MSYVQSNAVRDISVVSSVGIAFSSSLTVGTWLVAWVHWSDQTLTPTVSDPSNGSWTALGTPLIGASGGLAGYVVQAFARQNGATGTPTVTFATSAACDRHGLLIAEYSGVGSVESVAYNEAGSGPTGTTVSGPARTPALSSDQVLAMAFPQVEASAVDGSFTSRLINFAGGTARAVLADIVAPTGGNTYTPTFTVPNNTDVLMGAVVLAAPVGGGAAAPSRSLLGVGV